MYIYSFFSLFVNFEPVLDIVTFFFLFLFFFDYIFDKRHWPKWMDLYVLER